MIKLKNSLSNRNLGNYITEASQQVLGCILSSMTKPESKPGPLVHDLTLLATKPLPWLPKKVSSVPGKTPQKTRSPTQVAADCFVRPKL